MTATIDSILDRLAVRSPRFFDAMSRETCAYECTLLLDGRPLAYVRNDGGGGSDLWQKAPDADMREMCAAQRSLDSEMEGLVGFPCADMFVLSLACGMDASTALVEIADAMGC